MASPALPSSGQLRELVVGHLVAGPGEKQFGLVEVTAGGQKLAFPVFLINGREPGPTFVATAGVHAAEYASIAAALEVARALRPADLRGRAIIAPVVNVPGFPVRSIYVCPLDGQNPNRFFPGNPEGSGSEQLAAWVYQNVISQADYYVDLHGGDLIEDLLPFSIVYLTGNEAVDRASMAMARVFGIRDIVRSVTVGSAYSAAARAGIPALLSEAGHNGLWSAEDVALHREGLYRLMRHIGLLDGGEPAAVPTVLHDRFVWLRSQATGFWYPRVAVGDQVQEGQELGRVLDHEGQTLQVAGAPASGTVLFLVTSLAINPNDPLLAVGT